VIARLVLGLVLMTGCGRGAAGGADKDDKDHKEDEHAADKVTLTREQVRTAKIVTVPAATRAVSTEIAATAEIVPPDDGVARIGAKVPGRITKLAVGVGDLVKAGQLIAYVDSPELGRAKADYIAAVAIAKLTRETADREQALFEKKISSERDYRVAEAEATKARAEKEAAEARLHTLGLTEGQLRLLSAEQHSSSIVVVTTPIPGVIVERPVSLGQMVETSTTIAQVMDLRSVWIQVDVYEKDLAQLTTGQNVSAQVPAWKDRVFTGQIQSIGAVVDRRSRTVKVRVVVPNGDGALKPGMFAKVILAGSSGEPRQGLFVPAASVQRDGEDSIVFVPLTETEFQLRKVEVGVSTSAWVEIKHGVVAGEKVVTTGAFQLKSEARRGSVGGHEH